MINEVVFDKLLSPIVEEQNNINNSILRIIMKRLKYIKESDAKKFTAEYDDDLLEIGELTKKNLRKMIDEGLNRICEIAYTDCDRLYHLRDIDRPKKMDRWLLSDIEVFINECLYLYKAIFTQYYLMVQVNGVNKRLELKKAYKTIMDQAQNAKKSSLDFDVIMHNTENLIVSNGLSVKVGDRYFRSDKAVSSILNQSLVDAAQLVYNYVGEELKCDGIELSAHLMPAKDHADCQGHQFTKENWHKIQNGEDFEDVDGNYYSGFERRIGELNCRHLAFPIIVGKSEQQISDTALNKILDAKGVTFDTKTYSRYECLQKQKQLKSDMDRAKTASELLKLSGNNELYSKYIQRYNSYKKAYESFTKLCGLKRL